MTRRRLFRTSLILVLLVTGAAVGGIFIYNAAGGGSEADAAENAPETADQGSQATTEGEVDSSDDESGDDEDADEDRVPVKLTDVTLGTVSSYITATANLVPEDEVKVLAEAEGRLTRLLVEEGDQVDRGQLLATLLRDEAEIRVNKARLTADNAEMAFERATRVFTQDLISQEEFDKTTMDYRIAQQELAEARWLLAKTEIRAPFDGRVTLRTCTLGEHVRPGDELFVVTDFDPLIARIYLPEREVLDLDLGRDVRMTLKADRDIDFDGRILRISPVVDTSTGTVKVTVAALRPPAQVRPGAFVTVDVTRDTHSNTMLLPREAVVRELKKAHVFVALDGVVEKRDVDLGMEEDEDIEILSGISAGDSVVVAGQGSLEDGAAIKVLAEDGEAQAAADGADVPARG